MVDLYSRFAICFRFYSCEMFQAQFFWLLRGTLTDSGPSPSKTSFLVFDLGIPVKLLLWRMLPHFTKLRCLPSLCEKKTFILPSKKEMSLSGCIEQIKVPFHEILGGLWIPRKTTKSMYREYPGPWDWCIYMHSVDFAKRM